MIQAYAIGFQRGREELFKMGPALIKLSLGKKVTYGWKDLEMQWVTEQEQNSKSQTEFIL